MVRTRQPYRISRDPRSESASSSPDLVDKFADLSLKKKNMKKNNSGRILLSPAIEIQRKAEIAAKMKAEQSAKKLATYSKGSRPAISLKLYKCVKEAVEVMNRPGHREDDADLRLAESRIRGCCRFFSHLLPVGWKYERETASSLIAGYEKVFQMGEEFFII